MAYGYTMAAILWQYDVDVLSPLRMALRGLHGEEASHAMGSHQPLEAKRSLSGARVMGGAGHLIRQR